MMGTYDVKAQERISDVILDLLNRLHVAKSSGALKEDEFSKIITNIGDLYASKIKQGKVTSDEIESFESYLTGLDGLNASMYFSFPHKNLDSGAKAALASIDFAKQALEQRSLYARPVTEQNDYENAFRRLGH